MADSSAGGGFFAYYRQYARSGIHAASAAALTAFGLWASFTGNRWFILLAIAVYVLPPVFLYLSGEGENVPSVVGDEHESSGHETSPDGATSTGESDTPEHAGSTAAESDTTDGAAGRAPDRTQHASDATDEAESRRHSSSELSSAAEGDDDPGWTEIDTPADEGLLDVVATPAGASAVGEGGVVLARDGEEWSVALEDGPTANANTLRGVDRAGAAIWFAGDSGVLGRYADGKLTDHSAPREQTSTWVDVAVTGEADSEQIHLVNGSGELLRGTYEDGMVEWGDIEKPGSGSSIAAVAFFDADRGHLCDTNQSVYETMDGGESYEKIGIEDANAAFTDVAASDSTVVVAADDGSLFRYDGAVWTRLRPSESALSAVALADGAGFAAGDGGAVYERTASGWEAVDVPTDADLRGIAIGSERVVAVGSGGTVVER